jgi:hypothetical protein
MITPRKATLANDWPRPKPHSKALSKKKLGKTETKAEFEEELVF